MGKRSILKALAMGIIPVLHAYLFYCWCNEAKVKWRVEWLNSTLYAAAFAFPVIQAYPAYKLFSVVDSSLKASGAKAYPLTPFQMSLLFVLPVTAIPAWIYSVYRTQSLFNENGVVTLA